MLPDFPRVKKAALHYFNSNASIQSSNTPMLALVPTRIIHEGTTSMMTSEEGITSLDDFKKIEASFKVTDDELIRNGFGAFLSKLGDISEDIAKQKEKVLLGKISEVTESTGRAIDAKGQGLSPTLILQALEKIDVEFDDNGNPKNLALVVHPNQIQKLTENAAKWAKDPEQVKAYNLLMAKKREEWRARENSRKLVD